MKLKAAAAKELNHRQLGSMAAWQHGSLAAWQHDCLARTIMITFHFIETHSLKVKYFHVWGLQKIY